MVVCRQGDSPDSSLSRSGNKRAYALVARALSRFQRGSARKRGEAPAIVSRVFSSAYGTMRGSSGISRASSSNMSRGNRAARGLPSSAANAR